MARLLTFMFIIAAIAVPVFLLVQSRETSPPGPVIALPHAATLPAPPALSAPPSAKSADGPLPHQSVTMSLQYEPFKNHVRLTSTEYATVSAPPSQKEPWQREGKFVLKIERLTATGSADYVTWVSVDAVKQLWSVSESPGHTISVTVPYIPGSTVRISQPQGNREYTRFLIP